MTPVKLTAAATVLAFQAALTTGVQAQTYRTNLPEVLTPTVTEVERAEPPLDEASTLRTFREAYRKKGRPRIAVFWNRSFSDRLSQWIAAGRLLSTRESGAAVAIQDPGRNRTAELTGRGAAAAYNQVNAPETRRRGLGELADSEFEAGFHEPMLDASARLVDRATIMRLTESSLGRNRGNDRVSDAQVIETEALKDYADLIAEVTMLPDANAPHDRAFRVVIKSVLDGQVVANFVTRGEEPEENAGEWQATEGGYVKVAPEPPKVSEVGRALAFRTMAALSRAWM
jgi:hypothetical protein